RPKVGRDRDARADGPVQHLFRRERVNVDVRQLALDGLAELDVQPPVHLGRQARLDANFSRAVVPRLSCAAHHFGDGQQVTLLGAMVTAECAERAVLDADVREVDVAVDDVCYYLADLPSP